MDNYDHMDRYYSLQKPKKQPKNVPSKTRKYVKERDGNACVRCGNVKSLQLHHLITKGRYDDRLYLLNGVHDPKNLCCVCKWCHRKIHDDPEVMEEMLEWQREKFGNIHKYNEE